MRILVTHKVKNLEEFLSASFKKERREFFSDFAKNINEFVSADKTVAIIADVFNESILLQKRSSNENLALMRKHGVSIKSMKFFKKN